MAHRARHQAGAHTRRAVRDLATKKRGSILYRSVTQLRGPYNRHEKFRNVMYEFDPGLSAYKEPYEKGEIRMVQRMRSQLRLVPACQPMRNLVSGTL